jgi:hypothetical protein
MVKSTGQKYTLPAATGALPLKEIARRLIKGIRHNKPVPIKTIWLNTLNTL